MSGASGSLRSSALRCPGKNTRAFLPDSGQMVKLVNYVHQFHSSAPRLSSTSRSL